MAGAAARIASTDIPNRRIGTCTARPVGVVPAYDCIKAFSETDFTDDLAKIDIPVLVAHGDADQIVPFASSAPKTAEQLSQGRLKVYPGAPHGLTGAHDKEFTQDLLACLAE